MSQNHLGIPVRGCCDDPNLTMAKPVPDTFEDIRNIVKACWYLRWVLCSLISDEGRLLAFKSIGP